MVPDDFSVLDTMLDGLLPTRMDSLFFPLLLSIAIQEVIEYILKLSKLVDRLSG